MRTDPHNQSRYCLALSPTEDRASDEALKPPYAPPAEDGWHHDAFFSSVRRRGVWVKLTDDAPTMFLERTSSSSWLLRLQGNLTLVLDGVVVELAEAVSAISQLKAAEERVLARWAQYESTLQAMVR